MTHQFALQEASRTNSDLSAVLTNLDRGDSRRKYLSVKGLDENDMAHWIWILEAQDSDVKAQRLVSSDRHKPIFVLMAVLRKDEHFVQGPSLVAIYEYISRTYLRPKPEVEKQRSEGVLPRALDDQLNMTPDHFLLLMYRLVHHCLITFPSSLVMIAELVAEYIRRIPDSTPNKANQRTGYANRCMVFNTALHLLQQAKSVGHRQHSWRAQKTLLEFSVGLKRPLIIDGGSYRAMRTTLLGLKKSTAEKMTAIRYAKSWPPYIRQLDGTDEAKDGHAHLSRSVKAGILKRSEGYADDAADRVLDVLGGGGPGDFPTIHTRSTPLWTLHLSSLHVFTQWAAKVKATRNAHEAWQRFHEPPQPGLRPNFQVYAEMFAKLFAAEMDPASSILPGEAKETLPHYQANFTEFELERLKPCSPAELYERMLRDGNRPVHHCLGLLIRNAPDLRTAADYLHDSPLDKTAVKDLTESLSSVYENLARIPIPIFEAYMALLCVKQPRRRWGSDPGLLRPQRDVILRYSRLNRAVKLLYARLGQSRKPAEAPWHVVMWTLANKKLVLRPYVSQAEDDVDALEMMLQLFESYSNLQGLHPAPFDCLARCTLKVLRHNLIATTGETARRQTKRALATLKPTFARLITPVQDLGESRAKPAAAVLPLLYHNLSAAQILTYMEVLAEFDEAVEGVRVVEWVLSSWDMATVLHNARDPEHKQWFMLGQAIACFRAFAEGKVPGETMERLEQRFVALQERGGTWAWPTDEEVAEYRRAREEDNIVQYNVIGG